jgi:hypothetical protein
MSKTSLTRKKVLAALDAMMIEGLHGTPRGLNVQLAQFRDRNRNWLSDERIVGYGFPGRGGFYHSKGVTPRIAFYTDSDDHAQSMRQRVPQSVKLLLGRNETDIETEVINIGSIAPQPRPAQPGMSLSHYQRPSGTFGLLVTRHEDRKPDIYILSCNHVLVEYNRLSEGAPILQPGTSDAGRNPDDVIGELSHYIPIIFDDNQYLNTVDAALARVNDSADVVAEILHLGAANGVSRFITSEMSIRFCGRTSGPARGEVLDPSARIRLKYQRDKGSTSWAGFQDVVICSPCSRPGDSGAAVLSDADKVLGLIMAGSDRATIFCKMGNICDSLGVEAISVAT